MRNIASPFPLPALIITASLAILWNVPSCVGQSISIGQTVQVSAVNAQLNHSEVVIAADPANKDRLLACSMVVPRQPSTDLYRNIAYVSFDGGRTWSQSLEIAAGIWSADPSCAFGPDSNAFFAALAFDDVHVQAKYKGTTVLYKSLNGGRTWSLAFTFPGEGDREFLTVDGQNRRIYMVEKYIGRSLTGLTAVPIVVYDSSDGGASFKTRAVLPTRDLLPLPGYPGGVLSDGTFVTGISDFAPEIGDDHVFGSDSSVGKLRVLLYNRNLSSTSAGWPSGSHFGMNDDLFLSVVDDMHKCNGRLDQLALPSVAVDSSAGVFRDRIYVAWPDSRSGRCEILFSTSTDRGRTWSQATKINDDRARGTNSGPDDFQPVIAVNREGVVGVLWYDRRDSRDNLGWAPRFSASLDGGQTFLHSAGFEGSGMRFFQDKTAQFMGRAILGGSLPMRRGGVIQAFVGYCCWSDALGGETAGLTADASGGFHALWVDNRTGIRQVWTAPITVDGTVVKNGSKDLAVLDDVSSDTALLLSDIQFDRVSQTITANAYIQNTSESTLLNPLKLRVLRLDSKLGVPEFTNADNDRKDSGAVFDFSSSVHGNTLRPGQTSAAKQIIIYLDHVALDVPTGDYDALQKALTFDAMVFGKHDATRH